MSEEARVLQQKLEYYTNFLAKHKSQVPSTSEVSKQRTTAINSKANMLHNRFPNSSFKYTKSQVAHPKSTNKVMKSSPVTDSSSIVQMPRKFQPSSQKFVAQEKNKLFKNCANKSMHVSKEEVYDYKTTASSSIQILPQKVSNAPTCSKYTDVCVNTQQLLREMDDVIKRLKQKSNTDTSLRTSKTSSTNQLNLQNFKISPSTPSAKKFPRKVQTNLIINKHAPAVLKNRSDLQNTGKLEQMPLQQKRTILTSKTILSGSQNSLKHQIVSPTDINKLAVPLSDDSSELQSIVPLHSFLQVNEIKPVVTSISPKLKCELAAANSSNKLDTLGGVSTFSTNNVSAIKMPTLIGNKKSIIPIHSPKLPNTTFSAKLLHKKNESESQKVQNISTDHVQVPARLITPKLSKIQQSLIKTPRRISLLSYTKKGTYRLNSNDNTLTFDCKSKFKRSPFVKKIANSKFKVVNKKPTVPHVFEQKSLPEKISSKFKLSNEGTTTANRNKNALILPMSTAKSDVILPKPNVAALSDAIISGFNKKFQSPNRVCKLENKMPLTAVKSEATVMKSNVKMRKSRKKTMVSPKNHRFSNTYTLKRDSGQNKVYDKIIKKVVNSKFKVVNKMPSVPLQIGRKTPPEKCMSKFKIFSNETAIANQNKNASILSMPTMKSDNSTKKSAVNQEFKSPNNVYEIGNKMPSIGGKFETALMKNSVNACKSRKKTMISPKNHRFSNIYAFKKNSSQNKVYDKQNCFNKIIISPVNKISKHLSERSKNTKLSYRAINSKLSGHQIPKLSPKTLPKNMKSRYKIINKTRKNEKKSPIIISQSFILCDMDTEDPDISKEFDCIKRDILEKNKKNSKKEFLKKVYASPTTLINKNKSAQLKSAKMIKSKYSVFNKKWTKPHYSPFQKNSIRNPSKNYTIDKKQTSHTISRTRKQSCMKNVKRQYKLVNKGHTIQKKSPIIVSKSFILCHMDTEDPDISKEFDEIKRDIFEKNMSNAKTQLSKRIFKSKTTLVNKNVMSVRMRSANMIKSKYSTLNKRYRTNYSSFGKYATKTPQIKAHLLHHSSQFRSKFRRNLFVEEKTNALPKWKRHYNKFGTFLTSPKKPTATKKQFKTKNRRWIKPVANRLASQVLHRSINKALSSSTRKKMSKVNMHCLFYNRFGRCNKASQCRYVHDPSKIAVCTRFLRGTCKTRNCLFSHEKCPGKIALCSYFLLGSCTKLGCPYRHENLAPDAQLCKEFVKGYCAEGKQCQKAHVLVCPHYIQGTCEKGEKCTFPHPPQKRKRNIIEAHDFPAKEKCKKGADDFTELDERYFEQKQCQEVQDSVIPSRTAISEQPSFIALSLNNSEMEM